MAAVKRVAFVETLERIVAGRRKDMDADATTDPGVAALEEQIALYENLGSLTADVPGHLWDMFEQCYPSADWNSLLV
jgi:hypothetical protein